MFSRIKRTRLVNRFNQLVEDINQFREDARAQVEALQQTIVDLSIQRRDLEHLADVAESWK